MASPDDEYVNDHPVTELSDEIGIWLDMDKNGDVNLGHAINNLANYVAAGDLDQETANLF